MQLDTRRAISRRPILNTNMEEPIHAEDDVEREMRRITNHLFSKKLISTFVDSDARCLESIPYSLQQSSAN